jgi:hypothetical protein
MAETRPTSPGRTGGPPVETGGLNHVVPVPAAKAPARGKWIDRWPSAKELANLLVNGILTLPARYRRGMFLDVLI